MATHHLISISEDELRGWQGDYDELLRNIGSAIVLACLGDGNEDVSIRQNVPDTNFADASSLITVRHIEKHDADHFAIWVWAAGDNVCLADLPGEDLILLQKLTNAVLQENFGKGEDQ
jgi:hypothetical protein